MDHTVSAQEIKRRGISAVDEALQHGPVHVIRRNRPSYVILTEEDYQRLRVHQHDSRALWERLLHRPLDEPSEGRTARELAEELEAEQDAWDTTK